MLEIGKVLSPGWVQFRWKVDEVSEMKGLGPFSPILEENDGENRRKTFGLWVSLTEVFPNAELILEEPQGHPGIRESLVLEEEVDKNWFLEKADREEEIGVSMV